MSDQAMFLVDAVLEGGPSDIPRAYQVDESALAQRKLKIRYGNGYEHFELVGEDTEVLFRWIMRTKIAE